MSPLWGFKTFGFPVRYKHVAPLGLKTGNSRPLYMAWGERRAVTLLYTPKYVLDSDDDAEA